MSEANTVQIQAEEIIGLEVAEIFAQAQAKNITLQRRRLPDFAKSISATLRLSAKLRKMLAGEGDPLDALAILRQLKAESAKRDAIAPELREKASALFKAATKLHKRQMELLAPMAERGQELLNKYTSA